MPDLKISAMPVATHVANADISPIVQGGNNISASRAEMLTAAPGESIELACQTSGHIEITNVGGIEMSVTPGQVMVIFINGGIIKGFADGSMELQPPVGKVLTLYYTPLNPADWMGSPASVWEAIDRIAAVMGAGGATPIP